MAPMRNSSHPHRPMDARAIIDITTPTTKYPESVPRRRDPAAS